MKINSLIKITLSNILIVGLIGCGEVNQEDIQDNTSRVNQEDAQDNNSHVNEEDTNQNTSPFLKVKEVYDGETLGAGTFSGYDINYYKLEIPKKGNLISESSYNDRQDIYLFDKDLNPLNNSNRINGSITLEAGSYFIKFNHAASRGGSNFFRLTLNSNVLFNQNNLPKISKGTQRGGYIEYYLLEMPKKGKLISESSPNNYQSILLYDINLNPINKFNGANKINGTVNLEAGKYIIKFNHAASRAGRGYFSFTLNSNVF